MLITEQGREESEEEIREELDESRSDRVFIRYDNRSIHHDLNLSFLTSHVLITALRKEGCEEESIVSVDFVI